VELPGSLRWWELLPEAVLATGLGLFAVTEPSAAGSAFKSTTAIGVTVAASVTWILARLLLARFTPWPALRLGVLGLAAVLVLSVVVLPAYDDTTVVEALPTREVPAQDQPETVASPSTTTADLSSESSTPAPSSTTTTAISPQPIAVRSSDIHGIDHRASGRVVVYRHPDGSQVVGLEDIDIQPGPAYDVYVVPGAGRESLDDATRLDDLRGNKGTQYYEVPPDADLTAGPWTVLVWCETFDVPIAGATPT